MNLWICIFSSCKRDLKKSAILNTSLQGSHLRGRRTAENWEKFFEGGSTFKPAGVFTQQFDVKRPEEQFILG